MLRQGHPSAIGAGTMLQLIRDGEAVTRADLMRSTGLARSTVTQRVETLLEHELVLEARTGDSTGGRPPTLLSFNRDAGVALAVDLGATHARLAVTDLSGTVLEEAGESLDVAAGPEPVLEHLHERLLELVAAAGRDASAVRGVGIGVPGPVQFGTGEVINPPIMPGWHGFSIRAWFAERLNAPVLVDNDVNVMAIGEHFALDRACDHLLFVKVATGIGCGIISEGHVHRGAQGAAGDIGHIAVPGYEHVLCECGNAGCVEAVAGGRAMAHALQAAGRDAHTSRDVVRLVRGGDPLAIRLVRDAGRTIGTVLAACVNFYNPNAIVIGGDIGEVHEHLLAGIREVVFQRSLPLATNELRVSASTLGERAGVLGAARLAIEHTLAPDAIDRVLGAAAG